MGAVAGGAVPHLQVGVLEHILRVVRIFQNGQGKAIYGGVGSLVQSRQCVLTPQGNVGDVRV